MTMGYMLGKLREMGFNSREDFIKANFHLLTDGEKRLADLIGLKPKGKMEEKTDKFLFKNLN